MLVALWDVSNQFNDNNGSILTNGKVYVYYSGRAALAPTWSSADGSHVNSNPIILDNNGRAVAFADDQYTYTCVVCDFYGRELFSFDPASFGTGGGGSTTEGNDAAHWIGATGTDVPVTALADTLLPLPSSPDYEGDFVSQTTYTTISLNKGLYMVDADIRIQQDDDLENIIKDINVYTGLTGPDSVTTSQKNWTGPEASDDRHYIHVHFIRHVADEGEDIYFQMNSPVDLSSAWIDKLSIVKLTEGGNGKSYVGGYGIDITGPVISVSGMIPEASAANFVDVSTYNTDIQNIYETIAETSAMIPSGVATEQFVKDYTSAFITEDALNGYATQQWVEDQNYITSADIPPIPQDVVTSGELATVSGDIISQIPSLDGYATEQFVEDYTSAFITSADLPSLDGYATEQYVQDYTSAFITSADVPHFTQEQADWDEDDQSAPDYIKNKPSIPSIEGLASEQYVQDYTSAFITSADIPDVPEDLVTSAELATVSGDIVSQIPDVSDMATQTWVNEQGFLTSLPEDLVTSGELATVSGDIMSQIPTQTTVSIDPTLSSGTKIAEFNINGTSGELFAPEGGGSSSSDVFIAEAFVTPYQDVLDAHDAGKTIFAHYDGSYGGAPNATYVLSTKGYNSFYFTCIQAEDRQGAYLKTISVTPSGWATGSYFQYAVPTPIVTNPVGSVLTKVDANNNMGWTVPQSGGSEVDIIPSLQTGTKIADYVIDGTSGELYAPNGGSTYTAGDNISIVSDTISVSGTAGLIAGENVTITASGDSYVISSTGSGGSIEYPLVYSASDSNDPMSSAYAESSYHKYYTTVSPICLTATWNRKSDNYSSVAGLYADGLNFNLNGVDYTVSPGEIEHWNNTYDAVDYSAAYWNSAYNAINSSASSWNDAAGMNEYPISAGPGMSIEDVDGVTVFSCTGGEVPADVVTSGQLATVSGEIMNEIPDLTGYATQTWVSDGFMETSGLEYNSQDEISGYNGHPVMTVDSEKQWLTHDDTIAHVTNSAQYAFGVNVPVVAQAMGIDETVLFTASAALDNISTSEVVTNFERLRIELQSNQSTYVKNCVECIPDASHLIYACTALIPAATYPLQVAGIQYNSSNGKDFTFATGTRLCYKANQTYGDSSTTTIANSNLKDVGFITKIVGIGRKENT